MGCRKSFCEKAFIRDRYSRSRDPQRGGQFSRGWQTLSRSKAPVQNCLPDLTVDLATEVSSTNKTDVKSHNPGPSSFAMDRQPCTKVNVPSYRLTDVEMATEGSLSVKLISQGQGPFVRGMWGRGTPAPGARRSLRSSGQSPSRDRGAIDLDSSAGRGPWDPGRESLPLRH